MAKSEQKKAVETQGSADSLQDAVTRVQQQFAQTGTVQASDIQKVLGGPTGGVQLSLRPGAAGTVWKIVC